MHYQDDDLSMINEDSQYKRDDGSVQTELLKYIMALPISAVLLYIKNVCGTIKTKYIFIVVLI